MPSNSAVDNLPACKNKPNQLNEIKVKSFSRPEPAIQTNNESDDEIFTVKVFKFISFNSKRFFRNKNK